MWNFFIIMGILLVIDIAYLGFWTGLYPFFRNVTDNEVSNMHAYLWGVGGGVQGLAGTSYVQILPVRF